MIYKVHIKAEGEFKVEADNEDVARYIALDYMTDGDGAWEIDCEPMEEEVDFEPDFSEMGFDPYLGQYTDDC